MSNPTDALVEKVIGLVSEGETERAIDLLETTLKTTPDRNPEIFQDVVLLSNMYSNFERQKLRGLSNDQRELNRISSETLDLAERIRREGLVRKQSIHAAISTSPDPLQPAMNAPEPHHPNPTPAVDKKSRVIWVMGTLLAVFVGLMIWGTILEDEDPTEQPTVDPTGQQEVIEQGSGSVSPAPPSTVIEVEKDAIKVAELRAEMTGIFHDGHELTDQDYERNPDMQLVTEYFGGTSWYHDDYGYLNFDADGRSAVFMSGNGYVDFANETVFGFYEYEFTNAKTGDRGYLNIIPPGNEDRLTVYIESAKTGDSRFVEMGKRN